MAFKTIFWDNDGTLVNTEPLFFEATQEVLAPLGIVLTEDWHVNEYFKKGVSAFDFARAKNIDEESIQKLKYERDLLYLKKLQTELKPIEGVIPTLQALYKKIPMGIVTTSRRKHLKQIMELSGLKPYFDFFICREDVINEKPDPEPYLKAWKQSGLKKEECLVIEDTEKGLEAAKTAGLTCFVCPTLATQGNDFSKADKVLKNVREILPYLQE